MATGRGSRAGPHIAVSRAGADTDFLTYTVGEFHAQPYRLSQFHLAFYQGRYLTCVRFDCGSRCARTAGEDMTESPGQSWDFFVSYTRRDVNWAESIAWQLESGNYHVLLQKWDFVAGSHWTVGMQNGMTRASRTLAVLSDAYLRSSYGKTEWTAAYRADPHGFTRSLIPVRIEDCDRPGILGGIVSVDLFAIGEKDARSRLLAEVSAAVAGRAKPSDAPMFPGEYEPGREVTRHLAAPAAPKRAKTQPSFPGRGPSGDTGNEVPRSRNRRRFSKVFVLVTASIVVIAGVALSVLLRDGGGSSPSRTCNLAIYDVLHDNSALYDLNQKPLPRTKQRGNDATGPYGENGGKWTVVYLNTGVKGRMLSADLRYNHCEY